MISPEPGDRGDYIRLGLEPRNDKDKPNEKSKNITNDINNDGVFDKKDTSLAGRVMVAAKNKLKGGK